MAKPMEVIPLREHPSNLDETATLVSGSRERYSVFRVKDGYVLAFDGQTYPVLYSTQTDATNDADRLIDMVDRLLVPKSGGFV